MDLTPLDYQILNFISKFDSVSKDKILLEFSQEKTVTEFRLEQLAKPEYKQLPHLSIPISNSSYVYEICEEFEDECHVSHETPTGLFALTDLGKKTLQDYKAEKQCELRRKNEERIWRAIPIIISAIALVISGLALAKSFNWL